MASLRATSDAVDRRNGRPQEVLRGTLVDELEDSVWNPGLVPSEWPDRLIPQTTELWAAGNDFYEFPRFAPPHFPARDGAPVPHLNLDELLWDILEPCFSYQARGIADGGS
jgi:predicted YcjX-like family ATPase